MMPFDYGKPAGPSKLGSAQPAKPCDYQSQPKQEFDRNGSPIPMTRPKLDSLDKAPTKDFDSDEAKRVRANYDQANIEE
jgi:hypothetical protein